MQLSPTTTVREVLITFPASFDIFLSHGMCESCQEDPPPVPLAVFAKKHCGGDLNMLIGELEKVIRQA